MDHHFIEREEGFTLHYLEWIPAFENDSLPVICIHGNLSNGRMFRWIGEKLSQGKWGKPRRVISIDLRGCGDSGLPETGFTIRHLASDIEAVLQHAGIEKAHFISFSRGVTNTVQFAVDYPGKIKGFVVGDFPAKSFVMKKEWVENLIARYKVHQTWDELYQAISSNQEISPEEFAERKEEFYVKKEDGIHARVHKDLPMKLQMDSEDLDLTHGLDQIEGPVLLLRGEEKGTLINEEEVQEFRRYHPSLKEEIIAGSGHSVFDPKEQTESIFKDYFESLDIKRRT